MHKGSLVSSVVNVQSGPWSGGEHECTDENEVEQNL